MPLLEVEQLHARYDYAPVLQGVSFTVDAGQIVSIFGRNGAGKTTVLRAIMGWLHRAGGSASRARASGGCHPITPARHCLHPRGPRIFPTLSVEEI